MPRPEKIQGRGSFHNDMQKTIMLDGRPISYELEVKPVKNINLRIRPDGSIHVSMSRRHSMAQVEALFRNNGPSIFSSLEKARILRQQAASIAVLDRAEEGRRAEKIVSALCRRIYPRFAAACGNHMPEVRYRRMRARWGSCSPKLKVLTFNTRLVYVPERCAEYVVVHEFCHFLYADHSPRFYAAVEAVLPGWKACREELRQYEGLMA